MDNIPSTKPEITSNLEQDLCPLSNEAFDGFELAINAALQIIPAIAALLTHRAPWDKD